MLRTPPSLGQFKCKDRVKLPTKRLSGTTGKSFMLSSRDRSDATVTVAGGPRERNWLCCLSRRDIPRLLCQSLANYVPLGALCMWKKMDSAFLACITLHEKFKKWASCPGCFRRHRYTPVHFKGLGQFLKLHECPFWAVLHIPYFIIGNAWIQEMRP